MPHVVTKSSAYGSKGDLAKITKELKAIKVNILAIGGAEGKDARGKEVGVVAMILDPDETNEAAIEQALTKAGMHDIGRFPNIQVEIPDQVGELQKVVDLVKDLNILTILSMGSILGTAHVGLGFSETDHPKALKRFKTNKIVAH
jgi:hypothetical protein